jgi:hypothetical protein
MKNRTGTRNTRTCALPACALRRGGAESGLAETTPAVRLRNADILPAPENAARMAALRKLPVTLFCDHL